MSDDLVQRMRKTHQEIVESDGGECELMADYREAADRIEALIGDVAHEKEYLAEAEDLISQHYERAIRAEKRIKELEADSIKWQSAYRTVIDLEARIKELEAALREIAAGPSYICWQTEVARRALEEK